MARQPIRRESRPRASRYRGEDSSIQVSGFDARLCLDRIHSVKSGTIDSADLFSVVRAKSEGRQGSSVKRIF